MKRFSFRLQPILQYREYRERVARQETALALKNVNESRAKTEALGQELTRASVELDRETSKGIRASAFKAYAGYMQALGNDIENQNKTTRKLAGILAQKQKLLAGKSVEKKVIERLKEKKAQEYADDFLKLEQKSKGGQQ